MCVLSHFRTCDVRAEVRAQRFLELCVRCACVRLVFGRAMCDCTFAHFFEQKDKILHLRTSFPVLECPFSVLYSIVKDSNANLTIGN